MSGRYAVAETSGPNVVELGDQELRPDGNGSATTSSRTAGRGMGADDRAPFTSLVPTTVGSSAEQAITDGFMECVARWGIGKTTIEDIAREAGVSRATVYRHFPGGKSAIAALAWSVDVSKFIAAVTERILDAESLEDALVSGIVTVAEHFGRHPALNFMREHEPAEFERLVSFERMDTILLASGTSMAPLLERFLAPSDAFDVALWMARILVSYLSEPADYVDLTAPGDVRNLVGALIVPGIAAMNKTSQTKTSTQGDPKNLGDQNVHC